MNKQNKGNGKRGIEWCDWTSNPIRGCLHGCSWTMPDGTVANCYAEDVADRVAQKAYPKGFEHHYWNPDELKLWGKIPAGDKVFVGSMADVFGHWVPAHQIELVLEHAAMRPDVTFQFLTKNPKRVLDFMFKIPRNCWIGASTPPSFMWNNELDDHRRMRLMATTLGVLSQLREAGITTWVSAEPLNVDLGFVLWSNMVNYPDEPYPIDWIVVGAASNGAKYYPPDEKLLTNLLRVLDSNKTPVFFKGNLRSLKWAAQNWREDFPPPATTQAGMF